MIDNEKSPIIFDSYQEAADAARRMRKASKIEGGVITRILESPYGGFTIMAVPAELYADFVSEGISFPGMQNMNYEKIHA